MVMLLLGAVSALAQNTITGTVTEAGSGTPMPGASVVLEGTALGAATNQDGHYTLEGVASGTYRLTVSFVGYEQVSRIVTVRSRNITVDFAIEFVSQQLRAMEVFASRAVERQTPVAFSTVEKLQVERELGSRDIPLVLNSTPSVYSTAQGGGAGDSRINVRGFNQRNVAVMINGVPVNDMENGWVYWSNWDGLGDATSSIQLQRGLSMVNLATPSIGGTLNILTDPSQNRRQVVAKQEVGNDGFLKSTLSLSTGLINDKYALTISGVRKTGDGYYDGTWIDAWAYYAAGAWNMSENHRLDLYVVGSPQRHGQNLYRQNIAAYDHEYARKVFSANGIGADTIEEILESFPEAGRRWNQNVSAVSGGYTTEQNDGFGTVKRARPGLINERENFYHPPQVNLNYYAQLSEKSLLSTVVYYAAGKGGGTGTHGRIQWDYNGPSRRVDYDATISANSENGESLGVLRNSHNVKWTIGAIAKFKHELSEAITVEAGLDWRTAEIQHYRTVRDLLGGTGYRRFDSDFWGEEGRVLKAGDRFNYNNTNTVDWIGAFAQGEYATGNVSMYGMLGYSIISYTYEDLFRDDGSGNPFTLPSGNIGGYQVKGGASRTVNDQLSIFANVGLVSKVPIFDGVINDATGTLNPDPKNEIFYAVEAGALVRAMNRTWQGRLNFYNTNWNDRTLTRTVVQEDGDDGLINITGLNTLHRGIEAELAYQPVEFARGDLALSVGNWYYTDNVSALYTPDRADPSTQTTLDLYVKNVKVGDAPQRQAAYAVTAFPFDGVYAKLTGRSYGNYYADFDPTTRTDSGQRGQVWKVPSYHLFDLNVGYDLPRFALGASGVDLRITASVFNVLDTFYIQDASNNSRFNAFRGNGTNANTADDAEVFLGLPRTFNVGLRAVFR